MKNPYDVLRTKEQELVRIRKEVEALKVVARLLGADDSAENGDNTPKMRQVVEVTYVVALEFKAGAVTRAGPQCILNILKGIPEHQVPAALQVVALP